MENMFKSAGKTVLFACLSLMLLTACSQKSKLKMAIEIANKQCPMSMGTAGEVSSIVFDGTNVVYSMLMNEDYADFEAWEKHPDVMKSTTIAMFSKPKDNIRKLLEMVVDTKSGMKFVYKGNATGKEAECLLDTKDLENILNQKVSKEESEQKKLEELVKATNISCPMRVDEVTVLEKLAIEAENVVYTYTIDENSMDIASLKGNEEQMKQNVKGSLNVSEPALKVFLEACVKNNKGLVYRYVGDVSGDSTEFMFSVAEITMLLK